MVRTTGVDVLGVGVACDGGEGARLGGEGGEVVARKMTIPEDG